MDNVRKMSDGLKDLISRCIVKDSDKRITVEEVLQHPFLKIAI